MPFISLLSFLFLLTACGKPTTEAPEGASQYLRAEQEGYYRTDFKPLNPKVSGKVKGSAVIRLKDIQFYARVRIDGSDENILHFQYLHAEGKCPDKTADLNHDGFIDFKETLTFSGRVLIPLDSDLEHQENSWDFPISGTSGKYVYSFSIALNKIMTNIRSAIDDHPLLKKLLESEEIDVEKRVLIIYGVDERKDLPESFQGMDDYPPQFAVPIACGEFTPAQDMFM